MAYLIDGSNFIGQISPSNIKNSKYKFHLIARLLAFQKVKKTKVYLIFDGSPDPKIEEMQFQKKSFSVIFPHFEQNADIIIKDMISRQTDLRRFFVVSSDREIKDFAKTAGAKSLTCREFNHQLQKGLKEYKKILEMKKNVRLPSPLEVTQWMELFKVRK